MFDNNFKIALIFATLQVKSKNNAVLYFISFLNTIKYYICFMIFNLNKKVELCTII